ncbi:MAG: M3 family oligoendopeptidase [Oscillospiraceae bacterium]|nr:M3 family oligoendopeptidase [Oscillospiraceae bacterium]
MNEVWDLDRLYKGFDDPAFLQDMNKLKNLVVDLTAFAGELETMEPLEGLRRGIDLQEQLSCANDLAGYASLRGATDSKDPQPNSYMGQIMAIYSEAAAPLALFNEWAVKIPNLMEMVHGDEFLKDYEFLFANKLDSAKYQLSSAAEAAVAKLEMSGSEAWSELQGYLTSTVPVSYRGAVTNLSSIRNLAYDPDPQVRKDAYEAELACYEAIKEPVAHALNAIKLETISDCQLRGYESPLARTLKHSQMKKETLEVMLSAMEEYSPKFWQYLKAKAKALGHENGLPWYDLFAPMGKASTSFTTEDAKEYLLKQFSTFDDEMTAMVKRAFDEAWIDFYPRDGKRGGAFCADVEKLNESRILTNFDGTFSDVVTLAHELGHAFHSQCVSSHRPLNKDYSMPVAETASTFNECVVMNAAIAAANDKQEKLALIESQLQDATQIICDIFSRYRFEAMVFENREEQFMNADTLSDFMLTAQKQSYGDGLDHSCLHPYMWICKSHYYGPTFYNFPYAFGGLFARGLYAQYEKEGAAFVPKYKKLLHTTSVATVEDTAKVADIDLTDKQFWLDALQTIADQIDLFCKLVEE